MDESGYIAVNLRHKEEERFARFMQITTEALTQLLPFELFSKKFCLNISELGLEIV